MQRRDKITIIADILTIAKNPVTKTRIMSKVGLAYTQGEQYRKRLLSLGLLEHCSPTLHTTAKGNAFLENYAELITFLKAPE